MTPRLTLELLALLFDVIYSDNKSYLLTYLKMITHPVKTITSIKLVLNLHQQSDSDAAANSVLVFVKKCLKDAYILQCFSMMFWYVNKNVCTCR